MKLRVKRLNSSIIACATALMLPVSPAFAQVTTAQDDDDGSRGDIVVTAQKRSQLLQDVGVSISAVTGDALRSQGVSSAQDISKMVAGVSLDSVQSGGNGAQLVVRGVSQSDYSPFQESPNSIYFDDVYLSAHTEAAFTFYDLERVEILRGPQGTLFGRASSGGLANFISKRPSDDWSAYVEAGYSSYNDTYVEGAVGGGISPGLRFRVSGRREVADGWWRNYNPRSTDTLATDFGGVRGQLEADLTDTLTARLSISYDRNFAHGDGTYNLAPFYIVGGQPAPLPANVDAYGTGPGNDKYGYRNPGQPAQSGYFDNTGYVRNTRFSPTLYLTWALGDHATLTSISNYTRFKHAYNENCAAGPVNVCENPQRLDVEQYSQELRLNGDVDQLTYTAGLYYLNTTDRVENRYVDPAEFGPDPLFTNLINQKLSSIAAFGQVEYEFTDKLKLTVGGRYTHDRKAFSSQTSSPFLPQVIDFSQATVGDLAVAKSNLWTGKVQVDYKPTRHILLYGNIARGAKGAGFNGNLSAGVAEARVPFRSEYLYSYEVGAKIQALDRRVTLNMSAFNYDYHHFQGYAFRGLQGLVGNYDGYFRGGEVDFDTTPLDGLNLRVGASYLESKLRNVGTLYDGVRDVEGVNAPRWTVKGSVSKDFTLGDDKVTLIWSGDYVDDRYASVDNNAATFIKGSFLHNARVNYHWDQQDIDLSFFVNNISNVARQTFAFDFISTTGNVNRAYGRPRWIGGSIRKSF